MNPEPRSIHTLLHQLSDLTDHDTRFLIAASINLYIESRRKVESRLLLTTEDIGPLFSIISTVLAVLDNEPAPEDTRPRELTQGESEALLKAVEGSVRRV